MPVPGPRRLVQLAAITCCSIALALAAAGLARAQGGTLEHQGQTAAREYVSERERLRFELAALPTAKRYVALIENIEAARSAEPGEYRREQRELEQLWRELLTQFPDEPETLLANGRRLSLQGSYSAALQALSRGAGFAPLDPRFPLELGRLEQRAGRREAALAQFDAALRLSPLPEMVSALAASYSALGQPERAERVWRDAAERSPDDPALRMEYGLALQQAEKYELAIEQYLKGAALAPADERFHNRAGLCMARLGRYDEALAQITRALALKEQPLYFANLAFVQGQLGEQAAARQSFEAGLARFPEDSELLDRYIDFLWQGDKAAALSRLWDSAERARSLGLYLRVAELAAEIDNLELRERACAAAVLLAPGSELAAGEYALLLTKSRRYEELTVLLSGARRALGDEGYAALLQRMTDYWIAAHELRTAETFLAALIEEQPQEPYGYTSLCAVLVAGEDYRRALDLNKRGLNDAPPTYLARRLEVMLTARVQGAEEALPLAAALCDREDADEAAWRQYIELLDQAGHDDELAQAAAEGLAQFPLSGALLDEYATALMARGNTRALIDVLSGPRYLAADYPRRQAMLGRCYVMEGNYLRAAAHFSSALELEPGSAELWAGLGEARLMLGELDKAREALGQALACDSKLAASYLWLGFALLTQGDLPGAELAFADCADCAPLTTGELAWLALGIARLSLAEGDSAKAKLAYDEARAFDYPDPRLAAELRLVGRDIEQMR